MFPLGILGKCEIGRQRVVRDGNAGMHHFTARWRLQYFGVENVQYVQGTIFVQMRLIGNGIACWIKGIVWNGVIHPPETRISHQHTCTRVHEEQLHARENHCRKTYKRGDLWAKPVSLLCFL